MKKLWMLIVVLFFKQIAYSQNFSIELSDNNGVLQQLNVFRITQDSLIITARSDYGRSVVNYLSRELTPPEKISMHKFVSIFPLDSLQKVYYNEYNNFEYIDADHAPRAFELKIIYKEKVTESAATNAYVYLYARLINQLNTILPEEIRIQYDMNKFKAFY